MKKSNIVDIPEKMKKFYGEGTMLHPALTDVAIEIKKVPFGKVVTIDQLCQKLANDYGTDVTCPMRTGNSIKKLAENMTDDLTVPYWRLLKKDGLIVKSKVYELAASKLEDEGFELNYLKSGNIKVIYSEDQVFEL